MFFQIWNANNEKKRFVIYFLVIYFLVICYLLFSYLIQLFSPFLARTETLGSKQVFVVDADDTQDAVFQKVSALLQKSGLINCERI